MVVTVYMQGSTQEKVRLGDGAAGAGAYEIYLNPETIPHSINFPFIVDISALLDTSTGSSAGDNQVQYVFQNCKMDVGIAGGNGEKFIRALMYWSLNDSLLYFNNKDSTGYDRAVWPIIDTPLTDPITVNTVGAMRVRVKAVNPVKEGGDQLAIYQFNLTVKRYTS